jgi:hypothetical protein
MKPFVQTPLAAGSMNPPVQVSGPLPRWSELPPVRQQEVLSLLASLLLRHWPRLPNQPQEAAHDLQP